MSVRSIYDARNNFSSLIKMAEEGEAVELTRHNKTVAVLLGADEYRNMSMSKSNFIGALNSWRAKWHEVYADSLSIDDAVDRIEQGKNKEFVDVKKHDEIWN